MNNQPKREYGIDLLRIIAAFMVTVLHVLGQGGILSHAESGGAAYWLAWLLEIAAYCAVNCFALISGYVTVSRGVRIKNVLSLWLQAAFYSVVISAVFFIAAPETLTAKNAVAAFLPILGRQWWYLSSYFGMLVLLPLLNAGLNKITDRALGVILATVTVAVCVAGCVLDGAFSIDPFSLKGGYSALWLAIMYLFGAYIKKRALSERSTAAKSVLGYLAAVAVTFCSKLVIHLISLKHSGAARFENVLVSYISLTVVTSAVFLLLFCLRVRMGRLMIKTIKLLSPASLGVYLIHTHPLVFERVIKDAFLPFLNHRAVITVLLTLGAAAAIFLLCSAIDLLRIRLFRLIGADRFCKWADNKITAFFNRESEP